MSETPAIGDNSTKFAADQLKSIIERVERLEEEKKGLGEDIRDIFVEAKGQGYDVKALRTIIRLRKQSPDDLAAQEAVLDIYKQALGMV